MGAFDLHSRQVGGRESGCVFWKPSTWPFRGLASGQEAITPPLGCQPPHQAGVGCRPLCRADWVGTDGRGLETIAQLGLGAGRWAAAATGRDSR